MRTVRFYTKGRYMGFEKLKTYAEQALHLKSWIRSGNDLRIGSKIINDVDYIRPELFK